jgi:KDO2-lipid IV(A) lauroyltransferase
VWLRLLVFFACLVPRRWAIAFGRLFGLFWHYVVPVRRPLARANVERALHVDVATRDRIVRECFMHQALYAVEVLRAPLLNPTLAASLLEIQGQEHLDRAFARGKGCILLMAHMGCIDFCGSAAAQRGLRLAVVAREVGLKVVDEFVHRTRTKNHVLLLPVRGSAERIRQLLADQWAVALVVDQHTAKHRAAVCTFFGKLAATSVAPARFAIEEGSPIIPALTYRAADGRHVMRYEPELALETPFTTLADNLRHNAQRCNDVIERWVREYPAQWLWLHRRWKLQDDPMAWEVAGPPVSR